jgi:hypothetical protein
VLPDALGPEEACSPANEDRTCVRIWASFATVRGMAIACASCKGEHDLPVQVRQCWADNGEQEVPVADEIPYADPGDGASFQPSDDAPPPPASSSSSSSSSSPAAARRQVSSTPVVSGFERGVTEPVRARPSSGAIVSSRPRPVSQRPGPIPSGSSSMPPRLPNQRGYSPRCEPLATCGSAWSSNSLSTSTVSRC